MKSRLIVVGGARFDDQAILRKFFEAAWEDGGMQLIAPFSDLIAWFWIAYRLF